MPLISRVADKGRVGAIHVVTAIALFAGLGGSALDHLITLTMRAQHGNEHHDILLVKKLDIMTHVGLKSPLLKHDPDMDAYLSGDATRRAREAQQEGGENPVCQRPLTLGQQRVREVIEGAPTVSLQR
jgi:hypothetical protein